MGEIKIRNRLSSNVGDSSDNSPFVVWIDSRMRFGKDSLISLPQPYLFSIYSIPEVVLMQHQFQGGANRRGLGYELRYDDDSLTGPFWEYFKEINLHGVKVTVYGF